MESSPSVDPIIDSSMPPRTGHWTTDESNKLKYAVQKHGGRKWGATAALFPGRTQLQCYNRWNDFLDPSIHGANGRTGQSVEEEVTKPEAAIACKKK